MIYAFQIDARLQSVNTRMRPVMHKAKFRQCLTCGYLYLCPDKVDAGNFFRYGVFNLQSGIGFQKGK